MKKKLKYIAFYLPQFHAIPENDKWWGKGFTEWTNTKKANSLFPGHNQPQTPDDYLGYYDLSNQATLIKQTNLAKKFGVDGFCFYYYWFSGKKLLEKPINNLLASSVKFPFCVCWANENWTRRWDGYDKEILMHQKYLPQDPELLIKDLAPILKDPNYIKVENKPLFIIYRTEIIPETRQFISKLRNTAKDIGVGDLFIARVESSSAGSDPGELGVDAAIEFAPDWRSVGPTINSRPEIYADLIKNNKIFETDKPLLFDYETTVYNMVNKPKVPYRLFRGVFPGWDNTPRKKNNGTIFWSNTPEKFGAFLEMQKKNIEDGNGDEEIIFINAWNEWAEGCHLEPDKKDKFNYLKALKKTKEKPGSYSETYLDIQKNEIMRLRADLSSQKKYIKQLETENFLLSQTNKPSHSKKSFIKIALKKYLNPRCLSFFSNIKNRVEGFLRKHKAKYWLKKILKKLFLRKNKILILSDGKGVKTTSQSYNSINELNELVINTSYDWIFIENGKHQAREKYLRIAQKNCQRLFGKPFVFFPAKKGNMICLNRRYIHLVGYPAASGSVEEGLNSYIDRINNYYPKLVLRPFEKGPEKERGGAVQSNKKISIIMLTFNRYGQTLKSIRNMIKVSEGWNREIIIFDNGSKNEKLLSALKKIDGKNSVKVIFSQKNLKVAGGRKKASSCATGDYIMFVDDDIILEKNYLNILAGRLEEASEIAGCCGKIIFPNYKIEYTGGIKKIFGDYIKFYLDNNSCPYDKPATCMYQDYDWLGGGAVIFKKEIFDKVEIDLNFQNAYEDNDYSLQLTNLGYRLVSDPSAIAIHHHHRFALWNDLHSKRYLQARNNGQYKIDSWLNFYKKWHLIVDDGYIFNLLGIGYLDRQKIEDYVKQKAK